MTSHDLATSFGLDNVLPTLVLVAPGFLVFYLISSYRGRRVTTNALFVTLASILLSGLLALVFIAWNGLKGGEEITRFVFEHPWRTLLQSLVLIVVTSLLAAFLEEYNPIRKLFHAFQERLTGQRIQAASVWDAYLGESLDEPVLVEMKDGRLIGGFLRRHSQQDEGEPNAVVLVKPALTKRDADGNLTGLELGRSILLQQEDVRSIVVLEGPKVDEGPKATGSSGDAA